MKGNGKLISNSLSKATILVKQFQAVFTQSKDSVLQEIMIKNIPDINHLQVNQQGVFKIVSNLNTSKDIGPDNIPNIVLKDCAAELSPGLTKIHVFQFSLDIGTQPANLLRKHAYAIYCDFHGLKNANFQMKKL